MMTETHGFLKWILLLPVVLSLTACSSTPPASDLMPGATHGQTTATSSSTSTEAEIKLLNEQSQAIIATAKKKQTDPAAQPARIPGTMAAGDQLSIQVWLKDRMTQFKGYPVQTTIPLSGEIFLPDVGAVTVAGKSTAELKELVANHFARILKDATILVDCIFKIEPLAVIPPLGGSYTTTADRQAVQTLPHVVVMGWVGSPGLYPLEPGLTIRDLLALSGKRDDYGDYKRIYVVRGSKEKPEIKRINLNKILRGTDLSQNIILQPNDAVYVAPVKMWTAYDYIRTILLPISAVRDAVWVGSSAAL